MQEILGWFSSTGRVPSHPAFSIFVGNYIRSIPNIALVAIRKQSARMHGDTSSYHAEMPEKNDAAALKHPESRGDYYGNVYSIGLDCFTCIETGR
jgi:hypothetical protein